MHIAGLQKLTLLDFPDKMGCIVFLAGCNLRCPFCHNAGLVISPPPPLPEAEFFAFLEKRKGVLEGVVISGGEPLLQTDLRAFVEKIKGMGYAVKLDTNGFFPARLAPLLKDGLLDYVAMDVKNSPAKYAITCGIVDSATNTDPAKHPNKHPAASEHSVTDESYSLSEAGYDLIKESARLIIESGVDYELRTTLVRELHTLDDIEQIAKEFAGAKRFFLQTFVDSGGTIKSGLSPLSAEEMEQALAIFKQYIQSTKIR